jgi:tetratricopeptide (TPR) repeat protein
LAVGWFWFVLVLAPVSGVLQPGDIARADRYTYLPAMGLTTAVAFLIADVVAPWVAAALAAGAAVALAAATVHLEPSWRDARSLWSRADRVVPNNYMARAYEADFARMDGDLPAAERFARSSVALAPGAANAGHDALADVLAAEGRTAEAVREYGVAIGLAPTNPMLRYQWAVALIDAHDDRGARPQLDRAIAMDPGLTVPRHALAYLFARHQQWPAAIAEFGRLVTMDPGNAKYQGELADALRLGGDPAGAVRHYAAAIAGGDRRPDWEAELAWLTAVDGSASTDRLAAMAALAKDAADRTAGRDPFPAYAYSLVLARLGRFDDAVAVATGARDLARATGKKGLADAIDRRLAAYRQELPAAPVQP